MHEFKKQYVPVLSSKACRGFTSSHRKFASAMRKQQQWKMLTGWGNAAVTILPLVWVKLSVERKAGPRTVVMSSDLEWTQSRRYITPSQKSAQVLFYQRPSY